MLDQLTFVLSNTTHPGNIGAAARALKVMGCSNLRLVNPRDYPSEEANRRSSNALDLLEKAVVYDSIEQAIADQVLIVGTSARTRTLPWPFLTPRELAEKVANEPQNRKVAILFGTENSGLTNEELQLCHYHVCIPTNPDYSSLNVASAIQLIAYEFRVASLQMPFAAPAVRRAEDESELLAEAEPVEQLFQHWLQVMVHSQYFNPEKPKLIQMRLRRILNKAQLTRSDVQLLRGFLASIKKFDNQAQRLLAESETDSENSKD